jgi:hypothetical protein
MIGARDYATLFETGQHGRLYLASGEHARGKTFHIWALPTDEAIEGPPWGCKDAVEVYGITGGHPGWTETYGWLHHGEWEQDFAELVAKRRNARAVRIAQFEKDKLETEAAEKQRKEALLKTYRRDP